MNVGRVVLLLLINLEDYIMIIYRVEDDNNLGPYRNKNIPFVRFNHHNLTNGRPSPNEDRYVYNRRTDCHKFGFKKYERFR